MARLFNGSSDVATMAYDLSARNVISIAYWFWADANETSGDHGICSYTTNVGGNSAFYHEPKAGGSNAWEVGMTTSANQFWSDTFTWPSAAAWHHFVIIHDRATPLNTVYVDGAAVGLSGSARSAQSGNFANSSIQLGRTNTTLWKAGRLAHFALWPGVALTAQEAVGLATGANPMNVHPDGLGIYCPLFGNSPEPDYSGARRSFTLTGTSVANHPRVQPLAFVR
jgi:hypothetical protein